MDADDYQKSTELNAFLASESLLVIIARDAEQVKLIRRLFQPQHRKQLRFTSRWHITGLKNYKDIPVVQTATRAYRLQLRFA